MMQLVTVGYYLRLLVSQGTVELFLLEMILKFPLRTLLQKLMIGTDKLRLPYNNRPEKKQTNSS